MESSLQSGSAFAERHLRAKIYQASRSIPRHIQWILFTLSLIAVDVLMLGLAFRAAYLVRFELSIGFFQLEIIPSISYYRGLVLVLVPFWLAIFAVMGLYSRQNVLTGTQEYSQAFTATTTGFVAVIAAGFFRRIYLCSGLAAHRLDSGVLIYSHWKVFDSSYGVLSQTTWLPYDARYYCGSQ
jgi:hypothetical protein